MPVAICRAKSAQRVEYCAPEYPQAQRAVRAGGTGCWKIAGLEWAQWSLD